MSQQQRRDNKKLSVYQKQVQQQQNRQYYEQRQSEYMFDNVQQQHYQQQQSKTNNHSTINPQQHQQPYRTSITQLISQPAHDNPYSMQTIYQSLYQLSDYLWNKKIMNKYGRQLSGLGQQQVSFDGYLLPIKDEMLRYEKFRRNRQREIQKIEDIVSAESSGLSNGNKSNKLNTIDSKNINSKLITTVENTKAININKSHNNNNNIISTSLQSQLIKCYQQVPYIYFQQPFSLNFANFHSDSSSSPLTSFSGKSNKQSKRVNNTQQMREQQQKMNDQLDLIEINLFGQIHKKFEDYFKAAANFDYLQQSITIQLIKLSQARSRITRVKQQFVEKSTTLRKKIIQRTNYQKTLKKLKLMRSLRKLPQIIQTILQSSLPYQCLELLNTTRSSITQVKQIISISCTVQNIKSAQTIVQLGLNKRYSDGLYMYVQQEVVGRIDFRQQFNRIVNECKVLQIGDSSSNNISSSSVVRGNRSHSNNNNLSQGNMNSMHDRSGLMILDQLGQSRQLHNNKDNQQQQSLLVNYYAKRQQAKQYQIAMILLQSYGYVSFPVEVTKIKLANGLRVVAKRFQKELIRMVKQSVVKNNQNNNKHDNLSFNSNTTTIINSSQQQLSPQQIRQLFDKVSIQAYILHIRTLNTLFKQIINRYLGYVLTLITEYEEKLHKDIVEINNKNVGNKKQQQQSSTNSIQSLSETAIRSESSLSKLMNSTTSNNNEQQPQFSQQQRLLQQKCQRLSKLQLSHTRFKAIFSEQITILPSIFRIIQQKIKYFLTLKNMSNASPQQFYQWVSLIRYWQRWFDCLVDQSVLVNYQCTFFNVHNVEVTEVQKGAINNNNINNPSQSSTTQLFSLGQDMISELISIVVENIKKSISTMSIKTLITQLTTSYINSYSTIITSQLNQAILQQSWQSVEIPQQFSQILQNILVRQSESHNLSLTILDSSTNNGNAIRRNDNNSNNNLSSQNIANNSNNNNLRFKFKILKNNILLQGQRYKLTMSFLLLCEFIQQMIRVGRLFETITGETDQQSICESKYIRFILAHLYQKIYQLIQAYNITTKQMILQKKALKMQKIKGNNIAVKHICLLSNCLTFLQKLTLQIPQKQLVHTMFVNRVVSNNTNTNLNVNKKQQQSLLIQQQQTVNSIINHNMLLIDKISSILNKKMQQIIIAYKNKQQQKTFSLVSLLQFVTQTNQTIVTLFLQITEIIDQYLDLDKCQKILKAPFLLFVQKYFKLIILKGEKFVQQAALLLEKIKFLKKYFKAEFVMMQREVQE